MPLPRSQPVGPVAEHERIAFVDVLRGGMLLGILVNNLQIFARVEAVDMSGVDGAIRRGLTLFVAGPEYTLFSLLIGYGIAVTMQRLREHGANPAPFLARRFIVLLVLGIAHAVFLFSGDVLAQYAVIGLILIFILGKTGMPAKHAFVYGCIVATISAAAILWMAIDYSAIIGDTVSQREVTAEARSDAHADRAGIGAALENRLTTIAEQATYTLASIYPSSLAAVLIGYSLGRARLLHTQRLTNTQLRVAALAGIAIGAPGSILGTIYAPFLGSSPAIYTAAALKTLTVVPLTVAYMCLALLAWRTTIGRKILTPTIAVGRLALTNYLAQSIICALIFTSYGFALAGRLHEPTILAIALAIFALQIAASRWWLKQFTFGPIEWLLRRLMYRRPLPLRVKRLATPRS